MSIQSPTDLFRTRHMKGTKLSNDEGDSLVGNPQFIQGVPAFAVGDVVRRSSISGHTKARSDSAANIGHGLALVVWSDAGHYSIIRHSNHQVVNIPAHGLGAFETEIGLSDVTDGKLVALSSVTVGRRLYLGFVLDDDHIQWEPFARVESMGEVVTLRPRAEPPDPQTDGEIVGWLSDGTEAYYDAGDIIFKVRQGGTTKSFRIIAYEQI